MAKTKTSLKPGDKLPPRGKAFKTLLMETIREESLLDVTPQSSKEETEKAFIRHAAKRAFDPNDQNSATILNEFMKRSFPPLKPSNEAIEFSFPEEGTPAEKAFSVINAISKGDIPPDIGQTIVGIIKDSVVIEEATDLKARIEELEKKLGIQ